MCFLYMGSVDKFLAEFESFHKTEFCTRTELVKNVKMPFSEVWHRLRNLTNDSRTFGENKFCAKFMSFFRGVGNTLGRNIFIYFVNFYLFFQVERDGRRFFFGNFFLQICAKIRKKD